MWVTQQCSAHLLNDKQNNATTTTNLTHKIKDTGKDTMTDREQGEAMKERAFVLAYKEDKSIGDKESKWKTGNHLSMCFSFIYTTSHIRPMYNLCLSPLQNNLAWSLSAS